jgi:hypothetical protein
MIVEVLSQARTELLDAVVYYEGELNGLGRQFWDEVDPLYGTGPSFPSCATQIGFHHNSVEWLDQRQVATPESIVTAHCRRDNNAAFA